MNHRSQTALSLLLILASTTSAFAAERLNVLMILVDDMNDWVGCLEGHPNVKTPNIDRLAKRGMLFTNAHVAAPVCNPSRVATMTGKRPSTTGIYNNGVIWYRSYPQIESLPARFKTGGYVSAGGGKVYHHMPHFNRLTDWHEYFDQVFDSRYHDQLYSGTLDGGFRWPKGFPVNKMPEVAALGRPPSNASEFDWGPWDKADLEMGDGKLVEWAVEFLKEPPKEEPYFLAAGIYRPHLPFYAPRKYFDMYPLDKVELPPMKADDLDDLPAPGKRMAATRRGDYELLLKYGRHREFVQAYLANISYGDALVGRLLDALDRSGQAENTIIVFWSDHGWHLGEKQHLHKFTLWERSTRVPFIIVAPGVTKPGSRCDKPVGGIDILPTLLDLCSLPALNGIDGISLTPLLKNPKREWRAAVTTHGQGNHAVRTERWRYIRYSNGDEELYDHNSDPNEWTNLAKKPELAKFKSKLSESLPKTNAKPQRDNRPKRKGKKKKKKKS